MSTALCKRPDVPPCTTPTLHARMLAQRLTVMLPRVATIRITLKGGRTSWPHLGVVATDTAGKRVRINRTQAQTVARWIIRAHPDADWQQPRVFDLRSALLNGGQG